MKISEAEKSIGAKVVYIPFADRGPVFKEEGVITSCNDEFVFVRYEGDFHSKATRPDDLTLLYEGK